MHLGLSLRFRLNLMIGLTIWLIVGLGFLFTLHNAHRSVEEETRSTVNLTLQLIEVTQTMARFGKGGIQNSDLGVLEALAHLQKTRHQRIQIISQVGTVQPVPTVATARSTNVPDWFKWAVSPKTIIEERILADVSGRMVKIRIEADGSDEMAEVWQESQGFLYLLLVLALAVYGLVHITVGRAFYGVKQILTALEGIEKGEYAQRLPAFSLPEFTRIAQAFNHTAAALEKSRSENQALVRHSLIIQEEERQHLARELHDELGQSLTAIKMLAVTLRNASAANHEASTQITGLCDRLFEVIRCMMRRLRPSILDELGLSASLEDLIDNWRSGHPELAITYGCDTRLDECAELIRIHLYRIVQECMTNVIKHADAKNVLISLAMTNAEEKNWIMLIFQDDGDGFDPTLPRRGFGLAGMRERVAGLEGRFQLHTCPGGGVCLDIHIPYRE